MKIGHPAPKGGRTFFSESEWRDRWWPDLVIRHFCPAPAGGQTLLQQAAGHFSGAGSPGRGVIIITIIIKLLIIIMIMLIL